jgi:hypothetical protein
VKKRGGNTEGTEKGKRGEERIYTEFAEGTKFTEQR